MNYEIFDDIWMNQNIKGRAWFVMAKCTSPGEHLGEIYTLRFQSDDVVERFDVLDYASKRIADETGREFTDFVALEAYSLYDLIGYKSKYLDEWSAANKLREQLRKLQGDIK